MLHCCSELTIRNYLEVPQSVRTSRKGSQSVHDAVKGKAQLFWHTYFVDSSYKAYLKRQQANKSAVNFDGRGT